MAVHIDIPTKSIYKDRAALRDHPEGKAAPCGPILRTTPTGVNGRKDIVLESQHFQRASFHLYFIGMENFVTTRVHRFPLRADEPAQEVNQMDSMVHDGAAA